MNQPMGKIPALVLTAIMVVIALPSSAEMDSEEVIKYRQNVMKSMGGHMGAMASIVRGKVDYKEQLVHHAKAVSDIAGMVPHLFPDESDFGETRAKAAVWDKRDEFDKKTRSLADNSAAFLKVVRSGKADYGPQFKKLAESCKSCHKTFREKK